MIELLLTGCVAVTTEIYNELTHLPGPIGECIKGNRDLIQLEVGDAAWDWNSYLAHARRMTAAYRGFISEYNGGRKRTIGLNDLSIIAMAKTLRLPVVSMETPNLDLQSKNRRIPDICLLESLDHLTFSQFLRKEGMEL